jgi:hypothetical protein
MQYLFIMQMARLSMLIHHLDVAKDLQTLDLHDFGKLHKLEVPLCIGECEKYLHEETIACSQ